MLVKNLRDLNSLNNENSIGFPVAAAEAFEAAVDAADPYYASINHFSLIGNKLTFLDKSYDLNDYEKIYVLGAGKAGVKMAKAIYDLLGSRITEGCVCIPQNSDINYEMLGNIRFVEAAHPVPDMDSLLGARIISRIAYKATERDLVFLLFSGGGSSLMAMPADEISLDQKQNVFNLLLKCGADIAEINTVRRHISGIKGGKLAEMIYPAEVIQLILSDIMGNTLEFIASGPAVPETTTYEEAINILKKYSIWDAIPHTVVDRLTAGCLGRISETVAEGAKCFQKVTTTVIADNSYAVGAAANYLEEAGFRVVFYPTVIEGEASKAASELFSFISSQKKLIKEPFAVVAGGEPTVTFKRNENATPRGQMRRFVAGGRAQEMALCMYKSLSDFSYRQMVFLAAGTDGIDGPTDSAGAIINGTTIKKAVEAGVDAADYLRRHDSYNFFKAVGGLIKTGYTGTNVNDIYIALVPSESVTDNPVKDKANIKSDEIENVTETAISVIPASQITYIP